MKKNKSIFEDNRVTLVAALVLAAISWIVIAGFISPGSSGTISYVLIDYDREAGVYQNQNLQISGIITDVYADVQVQGDGAVIGPLNQDSVEVYADYSVVNGPGTYEIPLRTERVSGGNYEITGMSVQGGGYSLDNPKISVSVTFEAISRVNMPITIRAGGITAASGFFLDTPTASPLEVEIVGPKTHVDQISMVVAEVLVEEELDQSRTYQSVPLTLLNASGESIDPTGLNLTMSVDAVDVDMDIMEVRNIDLTVQFAGLPQNFDTEWFYDRITLSEQEMQVAGTTASFAYMDNPFSVATFDVSQLRIGWVSDPINIELPDSSLRNYDSLRQVTVSFNSNDLVEKTIEIPQSQFTVVNSAQNITVNAVDDSLGVRLIGPAEQIDSLLAENIIIQIDASGVSPTRSGQRTLPVRVVIPSANRTIAIESYSMVCDVIVE